jgi:hypothetical protein
VNRERRLQLRKVLQQIDVVGLEALRQDEQDALDALPDSLQAGAKGEASQAVIDALDDLINGLEEGIAAVQEAAKLPV